MKKYIAAVCVLITSIILMVPVASVQAQPVYGNRCCDINFTPRCWIPTYPIGASCYCNGIPGVGTVC